MSPPDLPPRPVPKASLTDVVPRRTLVIIAVVVVLAVIGAVLALTLGGDDEGAQGAGSGKGGTTVASATSSGDTGQDDSGTHTDGAAGESATSTSEPGGSAPGTGTATATSAGPEEGKDSVGDGAASTHRGRQGYTIGLPEGWSYRSSDAAGDRFTGPRGQKLLIGWTSTPKDDPVADWKNQERSMVRSQYQRIRIEKVDYRGWNTADWEFTYVQGGTTYRSVDRGFVVNDHQGYGLMYTAKAADWDSDLRKDTWRTLTRTFRPKA
jgi:hypothetical protein